MSDSIIEVQNLTKSFGCNKSVNDISFAVPKSSFFAFLGQNGAGKSTTINMLIGLLQNDSGEIIYADSKNVDAFKREMGVVFQNNVFDEKLTVKENLQLYGTFYLPDKKAMIARYLEVVDMLGLEEMEKKRFGILSGGQKRKVEIARALFPSPKILFLDEPTTGLDPKTRMDVWQFLYKIRRDTETTLFLTTHYMEEAADADRIVIIHKGKKVCEGSPSELRSQYSHDKLFIVPFDEQKIEVMLNQKNIPFEKTADNYIIRIESTTQSIDILTALKENIRFYEVKKGSIDDAFLSVVGESLVEDNA